MDDREQIMRMWYERLASARDNVDPADPLVSNEGELSVVEAYGVQDMLIQDRLRKGERVIGWKVGATSPRVMEQLGMVEPICGCITGSSDHTGSERISASGFCRLAVEGEIAFLVGKTLRGPGVVSSDVVMNTVGVMGAVELVDCRIEGWRPTPAEAVADNSLHAGVMLGPVTRLLADTDLPYEGVVMRKNGELLASACGVEALGHPIRVVVWLANKLAELGKGIEKGQFVLTGSLTRYFYVAPGDTVDVTFSTLGGIQFAVTD